MKLVLFDEQSRHLDKFGPLLVVTVATVVLMSLVDLSDATGTTGGRITSAAVSLLLCGTLLLALLASGVARRWRRAAEALFALAVAINVSLLVVGLATDADPSMFNANRPSVAWVVVAIAAPLAVVRRLVRHRTITRGTMSGAIAAYLLLALAFCYLFLYVKGLQSEPFFDGRPDEPSTSYMYFSLTSVTTLGYGDLAAATKLGRLLATTEAVIGQVYLVTFVAMVVGLLIEQRRAADSSPGEQPDGAEA